jgi:hypothetical protein
MREVSLRIATLADLETILALQLIEEKCRELGVQALHLGLDQPTHDAHIRW